MHSEFGMDKNAGENRMTIVQTRGQIGDPAQSSQCDTGAERPRNHRDKVITYEL